MKRFLALALMLIGLPAMAAQLWITNTATPSSLNDTLKTMVDKINTNFQNVFAGIGVGSGTNSTIYFSGVPVVSPNFTNNPLLPFGLFGTNITITNTDNRTLPYWINVKDPTYGAKGDGLTDDTISILNAVAALTTNKPVLYCPAGNYIVASKITMPTFKGWTILGDGRFDTRILYSGNADAIYVGDVLGSSSQIHGSIENLSVVANGSGVNANGIHIANCYKVQINNVGATGFGNAGFLVDPLQVSDQVGIVQFHSIYTTGNNYGLKIGHTSNNIHDVHVDGDSDFDGNNQFNLWMWANAFGFDIKGNVFFLGANASATNIYVDSIGGGLIHGNYIEGGQAGIVLANSGGSTVPPAGIGIEGNGIQGSHTNASAIQLGIAATDRMNSIGLRNNWITGFTNGVNFIGIVNNSLLGPNYFASTVTNQYTPLITGSTATIVNSNNFTPGIHIGTNGTINIYDSASQGILQIEGLKEFSIFDNVTGLTRFITKTNGNVGIATASPTAPFSVNGAMDTKGLTNLSGVVDVQGGTASSVATPSIRVGNNKIVTFSDAAGGNTLAGFLWKKTDDTFGIYNGNSSSKGVSIDTNGDVTLPGGHLDLINNKFVQSKDTSGTLESFSGIDSGNNLQLNSPTSGGGHRYTLRKGDQTAKWQFGAGLVSPLTLSSNLVQITAGLTATNGILVSGGGITNNGDGTLPGQLYLSETNKTNWIIIQGRNQLNATITNTWPGTNVAGVLLNNGSGDDSWLATTGSGNVMRTRVGVVRSIDLPMGAWFTNGIATPATPASWTNIADSFQFADAVTNTLRIRFPLPLNWDAGVVRAQFVMGATLTNSTTSTNVVFGIRGATILAGGTEDALTFGTQVTVTNHIHRSPYVSTVCTTADITAGNNPAANKDIVWELTRLTSDSGDVNTNTVSVLDVQMFYTETATEGSMPAATN